MMQDENCQQQKRRALTLECFNIDDAEEDHEKTHNVHAAWNFITRKKFSGNDERHGLKDPDDVFLKNARGTTGT